MRSKAILAIGCALLAASAGQRLAAQQPAAGAGQPIAAPAQGAQFDDSENQLTVGVGKNVLVDTARPIARVALGSADIAVATAISPTEIMVNGKAAGDTSLIIWDNQGGRQFFNVSVRPGTEQQNDNLEGIRRELRAEMPNQPIRATLENGNVFLRGTVNDLTSADRAAKIAAMGGKVVNLLDVKVPSSDPQILLKVHFASVDRTVEKQLGINLFNLGLGNAIGGVTTGQFSPPTISGSSGTGAATGGLSSSIAQATFSNQGNILAFLPGKNLGADLEALETEGLVEELAQPNLLATNGKEASFLAGGEFPYPVVQGTSSGSAAVTIEFKDYGIRLNFIPTITPRGTIRLQVAPEVSALDYSHEVQISGFTVPGITTRKANTEVELRDGQTFVIGGLLDNSITQTFEKIPFLSSIPVIGKLFQSIQRTKNNTELIVIVTPEIVAPIPAGQPAPALAYPEPFLPPNSNIPMHNPDAKTADNTPAPTPATVPVETLVDSMKPEKPLVIESGTGGFGVGSGGSQTQQGGATTSGGGAQP